MSGDVAVHIGARILRIAREFKLRDTESGGIISSHRLLVGKAELLPNTPAASPQTEPGTPGAGSYELQPIFIAPPPFAPVPVSANV